MASSIGLVGVGQLRCSGRLTPQLLILRLTTRGWARWRRSGSGAARISAIVCSCAAWVLWGGKIPGGIWCCGGWRGGLG